MCAAAGVGGAMVVGALRKIDGGNKTRPFWIAAGCGTTVSLCVWGQVNTGTPARRSEKHRTRAAPSPRRWHFQLRRLLDGRGVRQLAHVLSPADEIRAPPPALMCDSRKKKEEAEEEETQRVACRLPW